ncbi:MAG: response regulator [Deltaproteobacteria bacterium]|nr:response regulator [Deltaproteobacteria bacterium]
MDEVTKILLVDDEKAFRDTSRRLLTGKGYDVVTAENGELAMEVLLKNPVDVILLDLKMPVMGGEEFLNRIHPLYPEIPVIVLTGHGTMDKAVECMKEGAYDFITKPFEFNQLFFTLERAVEKRKLEQKAKRFQDDIVRSYLDLSTEKKRLETIISCMANGVMVTNKNMEVILHNPALLRMTGISDPVSCPVPVDRILNDPVLLETLRKIQRGQISEKEFVSQEIHLSEKVLRAISAPTLGPDRNVFWAVAGAVTVLEDVTAFKELDRMKSEFVNMVAHELRSPLVSIRQLQSVLLEGMAGTLQEKQSDFVSRGIRKIDALLELINDLLSVARLEAGRLQQQQIRVDVSEVVSETAALMGPRARQQGITLVCSCDDPPPVYGDPKNIEKVIGNLISNAINYSPDGGKVSVRARSQGDLVEIAVADTGVGIAPEELPKIFDRFYRVKHPKTRHVTGTGLGLSLVKGIVECYQGKIEVESSPGRGSTFRILLPRMREGPGD